MGFFEEHMADGSVRRGETFTCAHCNGVVEFRDNRGKFDPPTMCATEHKPLCPRCAKEAERIGKCNVFEKKLELAESRERMLQAIGTRSR
jgi:hypothetical protein